VKQTNLIKRLIPKLSTYLKSHFNGVKGKSKDELKTEASGVLDEFDSLREMSNSLSGKSFYHCIVEQVPYQTVRFPEIKKKQ